MKTKLKKQKIVISPGFGICGARTTKSIFKLPMIAICVIKPFLPLSVLIFISQVPQEIYYGNNKNYYYHKDNGGIGAIFGNLIVNFSKQ